LFGSVLRSGPFWESNPAFSTSTWFRVFRRSTGAGYYISVWHWENHLPFEMDDLTPPGRSVDIELGGQEVITIDLDNLDPNPEDVLDLLKDGQCKIWVWTKLAGEYWRRGFLEAAEKIALAAIDCLYHANLAAIVLTSCHSVSGERNYCITTTHLFPVGKHPDCSCTEGAQDRVA